MSNLNFSPISNQSSSICPTNGRHTVGDGAFTTDTTPSVIAVCRMEGTNSMYYYSTTFSGGPGVSAFIPYGGFDIPNAKCPPDRGSSDWVTDSLAPCALPHLSSSPAPSISSSIDSAASTLSSFGSEGPNTRICNNNFVVPPYGLPPTPPPDETSALGHSPEFSYAALPTVSAPRAIPVPHFPPSDLATPPLTPDDGSVGAGGSLAALGAKHSAFIGQVFPRNALSAAPYAKSVSISTPGTGDQFDGVVLSLPDHPKTFYVDGKCAATVNLRESIVALLDLADEQLECNALVIALERSSPILGDLLHSLMYVGGAVVTKPPFPVDSSYVLVGMEI
ncbi:ornithine decarboxylase antizyme-domain-containing protein [Epithele typhae]|uniref:ornithine decarboxylase antizyme-domain-containing protein n=1 Tax=Epithele typhae TaxID=378194 RepID=UPI0020083F9F|nr:ornithine decarboxylase antizyme-domain-containing protein [Epithele typhae]KAH9940492.1 ornithine decarboxylase antizyme-domain-containing protein [Epithele typhae]